MKTEDKLKAKAFTDYMLIGENETSGISAIYFSDALKICNDAKAEQRDACVDAIIKISEKHPMTKIGLQHLIKAIKEARDG